jgi:UDP-3-O-[3-hydroxymyristoyl] glucosamine N-acyltransferase
MVGMPVMGRVGTRVGSAEVGTRVGGAVLRSGEKVGSRVGLKVGVRVGVNVGADVSGYSGVAAGWVSTGGAGTVIVGTTFCCGTTAAGCG